MLLQVLFVKVRLPVSGLGFWGHSGLSGSSVVEGPGLLICRSRLGVRVHVTFWVFAKGKKL